MMGASDHAIVAARHVSRRSGEAWNDLPATMRGLREAVEGAPVGRAAGLEDLEGVAEQLRASGVDVVFDVVTAAAILLAVAIGVFSTSSIPFIQQIGIATATGVLLDAFVVRALLVPSLMALLGKWNWWSPRPLRRLHDRVGIRETAPAAG